MSATAAPLTHAPEREAWVGEELRRLDDAGLRRDPVALEPDGRHVRSGGRRWLNAAGNDYLGLAQHPEVRRAAAEAAMAWGTGAGASRLITGTTPEHEALEADLARLKGTPAALLAGSGMLANLGAIPALAGRGDLILSDELNHASIVDGCRLAARRGAQVEVYPHGDHQAVHEALARRRAGHRRALVVTDGVFSMDGDLAPLRELAAACQAHDGMLYVDDAHGTGVLGAGGGGTAEHLGVRPGAVTVHMGTLSKAFGGDGGFLATSAPLRELLWHQCRTVFFSTAPSPPTVAAARAALRVAQAQPDLRRHLLATAREVRRGLQEDGFHVPDGVTPIIPVLVGDAGKAMRFAQTLRDAGVWVAGIRPPTVPEGTSRLRLTVRADFTDEDVDAVLSAFRKAGRDVGAA